MLKDEFTRYLREARGFGKNVVATQLARCRRLEKYQGDLDAHFDHDGMDDLIGDLTYTAEDKRRGAPPKHRVPIDGDMLKGAAALKSAARLYRDFRAGGGERSRPHRGSRTALAWPDWPQPPEDDMWRLARILARDVKFLRPEIVEAVTKDNARYGEEWRSMLAESGIDSSIYLWDDSPCAFPGVRRHEGRAEIANIGKPARDCLTLDDNDYPKHLWAFIFTGKRFQKLGPDGFHLAHLADHKQRKNRWREEFGLEGSESPPRLSGLFTSPANTAFAPAGFLKPTDFSPRLRALLLRRAYRLYGDVCRLAPSPLVEKPRTDAEWDPDAFEWSPPEGNMERIPAFLEFRRQRIADLAEQWRADNR